MKKLPYLLFALFVLIGLHAETTQGAVVQGFQGGTGIGTSTTSTVGQFLKVASTSPFLTYIFGSASGGSVSTSSAISTNNFPFWTSVGGALSGTSTLTISGGNINASGTIFQNGIAVSTATGWSYASPFTYLTTSTDQVGIGTTSTSKLTIGGLPGQTTSSTLVLLGSNLIQGPNASGTFLGANPTSTFNGDFVLFQIASSSKFMVNSSGSLAIATGTQVSGALLTIATTSPIFSVDQNGKTVINSGSLSIGTTTASGKSFVVGSSTVQASANGPSLFSANNVSGTSVFGVDTTVSPNNIFQVTTVNGTTSLNVASTGIVSIYGTSTVTLGGSLLAAAGNCTSTDVVVPLPLSTSTDNISVTPQVYPGDGTEWNRASITATGAATSSVTIRVCADVAVTPTATKYNFNIFRIVGL